MIRCLVCMFFVTFRWSVVSASVYWVACLLEVKAVSRALTQHTNIAKYCAYVSFCLCVCLFYLLDKWAIRGGHYISVADKAAASKSVTVKRDNDPQRVCTFVQICVHTFVRFYTNLHIFPYICTCFQWQWHHRVCTKSLHICTNVCTLLYDFTHICTKSHTYAHICTQWQWQ